MASPQQFKTFNGVALRLSQDPVAWWEAAFPGQVLTGNGGLQMLSDGSKAVTLKGGASDEIYCVGTYSTIVDEPLNGGVDTVYSWVAYTLPTHIENLVLYQGGYGAGNALSNILITKQAGQTLNGLGGDDVLVGGYERTTYEFTRGAGKDVIEGFNLKNDKLKISDFGFKSFADVRAAMSQVGADVVVQLSSSDAVMLRNVQLASLRADHFSMPVDLSALTLTFSEEFDSLSLRDPATGQGRWNTSYWFGDQTGPNAFSSRTLSNNGERQIYVDPNFTGEGKTPLGLNPFSIDNGVLTITGQRTSAQQKELLWDYDFTSGLITSEHVFSQTYGYFEMRAKFPLVSGAWPAFWLLPVDHSWPPELDVVEQIGNSTAHFTAHSNASGSHTYQTINTTVANINTSFHTYGVLWTASTITWYLDGAAVGSVSTPADMHKPMYMLANLAMGGYWPGNPAASTQSAQMHIDYIRAYSLSTPPKAPEPDPLSDLVQAYQNIMRTAPTAAAAQALQGWADKIAEGRATKAQALDALIDMADASTSVATLTYQFFTGGTPRLEGLDYLLGHAGGNANSLDSAYYRSFNVENRYINFSINLALGEGKADFVAAYGGLSMRSATSKAYAEIFGATPSADKLDNLLADLVSPFGASMSREAYFHTFGDSLAAKAAMIGWLLAEAAVKDEGPLALANESYLADLASGQVSEVNLIGYLPESP